MRNDYYSNSKDYINRWVVSYADFVTMLLALFIVMFAVSQIDNQKMQDVQEQMKETFNAKLEKVQNENVKKIEEFNENQELLNQEKMSYNTIDQTESLEKILDDNIAQNESVKLVKQDRGVVIRIDSALLFDAASANIKPQAQKSLNEIVKTLTKIDNPVIIEGHTDSTPIKTKEFPSNWELSAKRAINIINYLVNQGDIDPKRLRAVGYGEYMPVADNTSISGRMLNRRVDIIILDKSKQSKNLENKDGETKRT